MADDIIKNLTPNYEHKRDPWNGFKSDYYTEVIKDHQIIEENR